MSENGRCAYQGNLNHWIYPALDDLKMPDITSANISALLRYYVKGRETISKAAAVVDRAYSA